ncbi:MAG: hypothetical protein M0D55_05850 [Elusimicrobiota bacterium]|nr:MAG: hypothetical protein M0D55_05850 [Elusimicrobiota bacterium]
MKRFILAAALLAVAAPAFAGADQYGGFARYADSGSLKPFARDLGGVLGSATFQSGRSLGLTGFDVGVRFGGQFRPSAGNLILRNNGVRAFGLPWVQAEVGMPFKLSGFIRGISYQGLTIAGGGLRYGIYAESDKPWAPQVLVSGVGHSVVHADFSASHFGANLVCSAGTPFFAPYAGIGFDRTRLVVRQSSLDPTLNGREVSTLESRGTLGVRLTPYQFTYLSLAATMAHGQAGAEAGLGVRF